MVSLLYIFLEYAYKRTVVALENVRKSLMVSFRFKYLNHYSKKSGGMTFMAKFLNDQEIINDILLNLKDKNDDEEESDIFRLFATELK